MVTHQQNNNPLTALNLDGQRVAEIVRKAGQTLLLPAFNQRSYGTMERKQDGSMVTALDHKSQQMICQQLALLTPDFAFVGEEMERATQQQILAQTDRPCWCLDPLDGTSNFIAGMPCFAISLGLMIGCEAVAGWVYDPVSDEMFAALPNAPHLYCNNQIITKQLPSSLGDAIGFIDFKRLEPKTASHFIAHPPCHSYRNLGSCALEWAWLASGRSQFIIHGRESLWDFTAGLALANKTGCVITDFNGRPPLQPQSLSASILATANAPLHDHFMQCFAAVAESPQPDDQRRKV